MVNLNYKRTHFMSYLGRSDLFR